MVRLRRHWPVAANASAHGTAKNAKLIAVVTGSGMNFSVTHRASTTNSTLSPRARRAAREIPMPPLPRLPGLGDEILDVGRRRALGAGQVDDLAQLLQVVELAFPVRAHREDLDVEVPDVVLLLLPVLL